MGQTTRQIAAVEFGNGIESAGAEQEMWDNLPTMAIDCVERIVRIAEPREQYGLMVAAVGGTVNPERVATLKSRFSATELSQMLK